MAEKLNLLNRQSAVASLPRDVITILISWHEDETRTIKICGPTQALRAIASQNNFPAKPGCLIFLRNSLLPMQTMVFGQADFQAISPIRSANDLAGPAGIQMVVRVKISPGRKQNVRLYPIEKRPPIT
jgi:hypothetical protein